jgi:integrase
MRTKCERAPGLTKRIVASATYEGDATKNEKCILWDDDPVGLGLRIYPSGKKAWVLQYRNEGKQKLPTLAPFGVFTLDQARSEAKTKLRNLEAGIDPLRERKQRRVVIQSDTLKEITDGWLADRTPKSAKSIRRNAEMYVYPRLDGETRSWRTLTRTEIRLWHAALGRDKTKSIANSCFEALRAAIYWRIWHIDEAAGQTAHRDDYQRDARNPCAGIKMFPKKVRRVRISPDDWPRFAEAIRYETSPERHKKVVAGQGAKFTSNHAKTDPYMRAIFHFIVSTGCRKSEARMLKWEDVHFGKQPHVTFRLTKSKNGEDRDRVVPLSDYTLDILKALEPVKGNPFIFIGFNIEKPLSNINDAWVRIRARAGMPHITIHDLRRSFGSWLGDEGYSEKQVGTVLGHQSIVTSRVYMQLSQAPQQRAVATVSALIKAASKHKRRPRAPATSDDQPGRRRAA